MRIQVDIYKEREYFFIYRYTLKVCLNGLFSARFIFKMTFLLDKANSMDYKKTKPNSFWDCTASDHNHISGDMLS